MMIKSFLVSGFKFQVSSFHPWALRSAPRSTNYLGRRAGQSSGTFTDLHGNGEGRGGPGVQSGRASVPPARYDWKDSERCARARIDIVDRCA